MRTGLNSYRLAPSDCVAPRLLSLSIFFFWLHCKTCEILVPQPGIEPGPAVRARNPNYWTAREVPWLRTFQALPLVVQGPLWGIQASSALPHCVPRPLTTETPAAPCCSHACAPAGPCLCFPVTWLTLKSSFRCQLRVISSRKRSLLAQTQ